MTLQRSRNIPAHRAAVRQLPLFASFDPGVTMHTTGLAGRPIARLYEGGLGAALRDARARTLSLYGHLDLESLAVPCIPIVNPPLWELGHMAWFQEHWCRRYAGAGRALRPSILEGADALYDSAAVAHDTRWHLPLPTPARLRGYMNDTLGLTLEALDALDEDVDPYFFELALLHEDMHGEALLMTLQTLTLPAPPIAGLAGPQPMRKPSHDIRFEGGEFRMGTEAGGERFVFDNEKWAHPVRVAPFSIASRPVSQGEYAEFVASGGTQPAHWRREGRSWQVRRFDRWEALDPDAPMMHVTLRDAEAYCRGARRRLPTEAEWEFAAVHGGHSFEHGSVWEWTSSPFTPYPGFAPDPYREYSEPWFASHFVLRGGSFATRPRLVHERFRNFYLPERADVFVGLRTCAESQ